MKNAMTLIREALVAEGWTEVTPTFWKFQAGVEAYEIHLTFRGAMFRHASLWDTTSGTGSLLDSVYATQAAAAKVVQVKSWAADPSMYQFTGGL